MPENLLPLSRRSFLAHSATLVASAGLPFAALRAADPPGQDAALDQIAEIHGGWDFDWEAGQRAWVADGRPPESPVAHGLARIFLRRSHAIQCAMRAEENGAAPPHVVAALLHDIGHVFAAPAPAGREAGYDDRHELIGALWLRNIFVPDVSEPVLNHVGAKRYLVSTRKDYWERLERDSKDSFMRQGGKMTPEEIDAYRTQPFWEEGVNVRLWDDQAKSWQTRLKPLEHYLPQLEASLRT
jgi:predicted HD phosphohydrolase